MKIGQRVNTPDGPGHIEKVEGDNSSKIQRYGVKHDIFPKDKPMMYAGDILFYTRKDVTKGIK